MMTAILAALHIAGLFMFCVSGLMLMSAMRLNREIVSYHLNLVQATQERAQRSGRRL